MQVLVQDLKYGIRTLLKSPGFTLIAVASLSLGIGANTAIFSLLNAALLRTLPVRQPHELRVLNWVGDSPLNMMTSGRTESTPGGLTTSDAFSYAAYRRFRDRADGFGEVVACSQLFPGVTLTTHDGTHAVRGLMVSGNLFRGLGLAAIEGRTILPEDDQPQSSPVAVISYRCWEECFGRDLGVIGQAVALNGKSFTVIGVLPRDFLGLSYTRSDVYVPLSAQPQLRPEVSLESDRNWILQVMARLRPGANEPQVQANLAVLWGQTVAEDNYPASHKLPALVLADGSRGLQIVRQDSVKSLLMLMALVTIVLLVACANLAGLLLARGAAHQSEMALRLALGAGRWRLLRQSLTEGVLLSLAGAAFGLLLASWAKALLFGLLWPAETPVDPKNDWRVFAFTLAVSLAAALFFGLLLAMRAARTDPIASLKNRSALGLPHLRLGEALISTQVGLSLLLLVGAGLFARTLINLHRVDTGFNTRNLLVFQLNASQAGYKDGQLVGFYEQVRMALAGLSGVQAVASSNLPLLTGWMNNSMAYVPGPAATSQTGTPILGLSVSDSFLSTMRVPLLVGRDFTGTDNQDGPKVIIVNNTLARTVFPNENPVGKALRINSTDYQIVGTCGDIAYASIKKSPEPTVFFPYRQRPSAVSRMYYEVRTAMDPMALVPVVRKVVADLDRNVPLSEIKTQAIQLEESIARERCFASLTSTLALLALLLSCIGLYGLMAYDVSRRTGEIGIRMALGAAPTNVLWAVLREALLMIAPGIAVGIPVALVIMRIIRSYLFGVEPYDATTLIGAAVSLLAITILAAWFPARRAAQVDPMVALRTE